MHFRSRSRADIRPASTRSLSCAKWDNPRAPLSLPTSLQESEPWAVAVPSRRRTKRRRRIPRRGWIALGVVLAVVLTAGGGVLAFENARPASVDLNLKSGQIYVPTYSQLVFSFRRPVSPSAVEAAFTITPATHGTITATSGPTTEAWSPSKALAGPTSTCRARAP